VIARGRVVGEGTPRDLGARLGGGCRVVLRVDGPRDAVEAALATVPGVGDVRSGDGGFVLEGAGDLARAASELARARGWTILELREEAPDLEDIFLRLVREGARRP